MQLAFRINRSNALKALQAMPDELGRALRLGLKAGVRDVQVGAIQDHRFTSRSGNADRSIATHVEGLKGRVFLDTGIAPYAPFLHEGTGYYGPRGHAFIVAPKNKKALRWVSGGRFRFSSRPVTIVGIKGDSFLYRSADRERPNIEKRLDRAIIRTIKDRGL